MKRTTPIAEDLFDSILHKSYADLSYEERQAFLKAFDPEDYDPIRQSLLASQDYFKDTFDLLKVRPETEVDLMRRLQNQKRQPTGIRSFAPAIRAFFNWRVPIYQVFMVGMIFFTGYLAVRKSNEDLAPEQQPFIADSLRHQHLQQNDSNATPVKNMQQIPATPRQHRLADSTTLSHKPKAEKNASFVDCKPVSTLSRLRKLPQYSHHKGEEKSRLFNPVLVFDQGVSFPKETARVCSFILSVPFGTKKPTQFRV